MNNIINKLLSFGNKFMSEMHLRETAMRDKSGFTYSAVGPFTKNKQQIQKLNETKDFRYIFKNELDKSHFQHDMAYVNFKDLARKTDSVLDDKEFEITQKFKV